MDDPERVQMAEKILALAFSLRPTGPDVTKEAGQAWVLSVASTAMARAILASLGPQGDPTELLELSAIQVKAIVTETQEKYYRDKLTMLPGARPS